MDWAMRQKGKLRFKYDIVEECMIIQCVFSFYYRYILFVLTRGHLQGSGRVAAAEATSFLS